MKKLTYTLATLALPILFACGDDNSSNSNTPSQADSSKQTTTPSTPSTQVAPKNDSNTADSAHFDITFTGLWTASRQPVNYPSDAHFSPLIGTTHNSKLTLWAVGQLASPGIQSMAETGSTTQLESEISMHRAQGVADALVKGQRIDATESTTVSVTVSKAFPLLTVTSMIAPSPDWFVGVYARPLMQNDVWIDEATIPLQKIYDAGTDGGTDFTSANAPLNPHVPIKQLLDKHFNNNSQPIAQLVIKRKQ
ncbi:MAG: spondin domain-containing protein [Myxococcota bacterium]